MSDEKPELGPKPEPPPREVVCVEMFGCFRVSYPEFYEQGPELVDKMLERYFGQNVLWPHLGNEN